MTCIDRGGGVGVMCDHGCVDHSERSFGFCQPLFWADHAASRSMLCLMMDDCRGNASRPPLSANLWRRISEFLSFPAPMHMIYVFGGRTKEPSGYEPHLSTAEVFDWWHGEWFTIPSMSTPRVGAAAAVIEYRILIAGGYAHHAERPLDSVESYDPLRCRWTQLAPMPTKRYGLVLVSIKDRAYAIGGDNGDDVSAANEVYRPSMNAWSSAAPLPEPLAGGKAEAHEGHIFYAGGCTRSEVLSTAILDYDSVLDVWRHAVCSRSQAVLSLQTARTSFAMNLLPSVGISNCIAQCSSPPKLFVAGGVAGQIEEPFLSDAELIPIFDAPETDDSGTSIAATIPGMPQIRSGCRSYVFWPEPHKHFLPWASSLSADSCSSTAVQHVEQTIGGDAQRSSPFIVVLGGETPCFEDDTPDMSLNISTEPCIEPAVFDVASSCWYDCDDCSTFSEVHLRFLSSVAELRSNRVAFATASAYGLPRVLSHGG